MNMQTSHHNRSAIKRGLGAAFVIGLLAVTMFAFVRAEADTPPAASEPAIPRGAPIASWRDNGRDGTHLLRIIAGKPIPRGATLRGVVTSDTSCEPDASGFSHCHNNLDLADGTHVVVVDTHQMSRYPCLTRGEDVQVTGFDGQWVVLKLSGSPGARNRA